VIFRGQLSMAGILYREADIIRSIVSMCNISIMAIAILNIIVVYKCPIH
jgi:hypothetical protein